MGPLQAQLGQIGTGHPPHKAMGLRRDNTAPRLEAMRTAAIRQARLVDTVPRRATEATAAMARLQDMETRAVTVRLLVKVTAAGAVHLPDTDQDRRAMEIRARVATARRQDMETKAVTARLRTKVTARLRFKVTAVGATLLLQTEAATAVRLRVKVMAVGATLLQVQGLIRAVGDLVRDRH